MSYLSAIALRYVSLLLQFCLIVIIARRLSHEEAGVYLQVFGAVSATFFIAGFGVPDGLVKALAGALAAGQPEYVRPYIERGVGYTIILSSISALAVGSVIAHYADRWLVLCGSIWWFSYGFVFLASQILVALGYSALGAFFYYPAMNVALFVTSVPYLLLASDPNVFSLLVATVVGAGVACVGGAATLLTAYRAYPKSNVVVTMRPVFGLGLWLAMSRVLQTSIYWFPVWATGFYYGPAAASVMGAASRLNVGFAAIMAAIRFSIRPEIVHFAARHDWEGLQKKSSTLATGASVLALIAIAAAAAFGRWALGLVFGVGYEGVAVLLVFLLIGTLGECIGGPVDEILKMTGRARMMLWFLASFVTVEVFLIWFVSDFGTTAIAAAQGVTFLAMYLAMLFWVKRERHVYVGATFSLRAVKRFWRGNCERD